MHQGMHRLFLVQCEELMRSVSAADCERCGRGSVGDNRCSVLCGGATRYFLTPCFVDMRAAASVHECEKCTWGEVGQDRLRVYCSRF